MDIHIGTSKCDLFLQLEEKTEGIIGRFEYDTDLFDAATISRMGAFYNFIREYSS